MQLLTSAFVLTTVVEGQGSHFIKFVVKLGARLQYNSCYPSRH